MSDEKMVEVRMVDGRFVTDPCAHGHMYEAKIYFDEQHNRYAAARQCINCGHAHDHRIVITGPVPEKVFCPECQADGKRSKVYFQGGKRSNIPFQNYWDESGRFQSTDPNKTMNYYECSRGHKWNVEEL